MDHPFDPLPQTADHLHSRTCGDTHPIAGRDCFIARDLARDWLNELRTAGLATMPLEAVHFVARRLADRRGEGAAQPARALDPSWDRHVEMTWIELTYADGRTERNGPMPHWQAELMLGSLPYDRDPDCVGAVLVAEAGWVRSLLAQMPPNE